MLVIVGAKELRFISGFGCFGCLVIEANKRGRVFVEVVRVVHV